MSTEIYQARQTIAAERKAGTLINAAGNEKAKTAIFLDNGSVVASPLKVSRIMTLIERSNEKAQTRMSKRLRVYDVVDPEPDENTDSQSDMSAYYDDDEDEYDDLV
jgi:hypothetical protein